MFLVGNRSVNMMLINECVNGCSLFEDNSHRLLEACTMDAHGACTGQACEPGCPRAAPGSVPALTEGPNKGTEWHTGRCPGPAGTRDVGTHGYVHIPGAQVAQHTDTHPTNTTPAPPRHPAPRTMHAEHRVTHPAPVRSTPHTAHGTHPLQPQNTRTMHAPRTR